MYGVKINIKLFAHMNDTRCKSGICYIADLLTVCSYEPSIQNIFRYFIHNQELISRKSRKQFYLWTGGLIDLKQNRERKYHETVQTRGAGGCFSPRLHPGYDKGGVGAGQGVGRVGWRQAREWAGWGRFTFYPCFHNIIAHFPLKEESRGKMPLVSCHSNSFPLKG